MHYIPKKYRKIECILFVIAIIMIVIIAVLPIAINKYHIAMARKASEAIYKDIEHYYLELNLDNLSETCNTDEQIKLKSKIAIDIENYGVKYKDAFGKSMYALLSDSYSHMDYITENVNNWDTLDDKERMEIVMNISMMQLNNEMSDYIE